MDLFIPRMIECVIQGCLDERSQLLDRLAVQRDCAIDDEPLMYRINEDIRLICAQMISDGYCIRFDHTQRCHIVTR